MCVLIESLLTKKLKGARTWPKTTQTVSLCIIYICVFIFPYRDHPKHTHTHIHDGATLDTKQTVRGRTTLNTSFYQRPSTHDDGTLTRRRRVHRSRCDDFSCAFRGGGGEVEFVYVRTVGVTPGPGAFYVSNGGVCIHT